MAVPERPVGYVEPEFNAAKFTCPNCGVLSQQTWTSISKNSNPSFVSPHSWTTAVCLICDAHSLWANQKLVWPMKSGIPSVVDGCPEKIRTVYSEARAIFSFSPRAAAALLRLTIQLVCEYKGLPGRDLNKEIGELVKNHDLSPQIQQSLDLVRVVGNNVVHPGQIVVEDNVENIRKFFNLVNMVIGSLIVHPAEVQAMYDAMVPRGAKDQIERRDNGAKTQVNRIAAATSE